MIHMCVYIYTHIISIIYYIYNYITVCICMYHIQIYTVLCIQFQHVSSTHLSPSLWEGQPSLQYQVYIKSISAIFPSLGWQATPSSEIASGFRVVTYFTSCSGLTLPTTLHGLGSQERGPTSFCQIRCDKYGINLRQIRQDGGAVCAYCSTKITEISDAALAPVCCHSPSP